MDDQEGDAGRLQAARSATRPVRSDDVWVDEGIVGGNEGRRRSASKARTRDESEGVPAEVAAEVERGAPTFAERTARRLKEGARAYRRERYGEARRILEALSRTAPEVAAVRELHGLALYRLGHWRGAITELEAAERLAGTVEHHPVLADCRRALGHRGEVDRLWEELRQGDPSPAVMVEGRIVMASALADRGDVDGAIRLLEQGPVEVRKPREHHLRLWYALASAHEQAGDLARARQWLRQVLEADPEFPGAWDHYRTLN